jgi:hypothetical protein
MNIEDAAQAHEVQVWSINNRPREVANYAPGDAGYGPAECRHCGADMHPVRRANGFTLCTPCASAAETATRRR